jgi:hypothetical protein
VLPIFHRYTVYAISLLSCTGISVFADLSPTVYSIADLSSKLCCRSFKDILCMPASLRTFSGIRVFADLSPSVHILPIFHINIYAISLRSLTDIPVVQGDPSPILPRSRTNPSAFRGWASHRGAGETCSKERWKKQANIKKGKDILWLKQNQNIFFSSYFLGGFFSFFFVLYSTLLHLPPLRFHCADGCWDRTQDRCNWCIDSQTL